MYGAHTYGQWVGSLTPDGSTDSECSPYLPPLDTIASGTGSGLTANDTAVTAINDNSTLQDLLPAIQDTTFSTISCGVRELCANGEDDDGDALSDCRDSECCSNPVCSGIPPCSTATISETILAREAAMTNAVVDGDFSTSLDFTSLEIVEITTGQFAGKGFSRGACAAMIEGAFYQGDWRGMVFYNAEKIYFKGAVSGGIKAAVEGSLTESVPGSGIYDRYQAVWQIGGLGATPISAVINVSGNVSYQSSSEFPNTGLYVAQNEFGGFELGDYGDYLSTVLTHVRVADPASPYDGEGFSLIFYSSPQGSGQGWTYNSIAFQDVAELKGIFSSPLFGIATATFDESADPDTLSLAVHRVDLELPPMADIQIKTWGPRWISPGQTVDYLLEYKNAGFAPAENVVVAMTLPVASDYVSSTGAGINRWETHEVFWKLGTLAAHESGLLSAKVTFHWGLGAHTYHPVIAVYATTSDERNHFLSPGYEDLIQIQDYLDYHPLEFTGAEVIPSENLDAVFSSDSALADLYQYALDEGFSEPSIIDLVTSEGPVTVVLMTDPSGDVRIIARANNQSMLVKYSETSVSFFDTDGGITFDLTDSSLESWGQWAEGPQNSLQALGKRLISASATAVCPSLTQCLKNCFRDKLTSWLLGKLVKAVSQVAQTTDCWKCTYNKDALSCSKCLANIKKLPVVGEISDGIECFRDCVDDPGKYCCTKDKKTCEVWPFSWLPLKKSAQLVRCDKTTGRYVWPPETIEFPSSSCGKCVGGVVVPRRKDGNCDWGIPDLNAKYVPTAVGQGCGPNSPNGSCTEIIVAHDPNIKYGPDGPVEAGQTLDYIVEYENEGAGIAFGVYFTDRLDEDLDETTLVIGPVKSVDNDTVMAPPGTYSPETRTITWFAGEAGPGEGGYAEVSVQVRDNAARGTEIINYATVYFPSVPEETRTNAVVSWIPLEICDNGVDDDNDTLVDCADNDCFGFAPACLVEVCDDGLDNDGDGQADCSDVDCAACPEVLCANGLDDDEDGLTDCDDADCSSDPSCLVEVCDDGLDNDGDGRADCDDADCGSDPGCLPDDTTVTTSSTTVSGGGGGGGSPPASTSIATTSALLSTTTSSADPEPSVPSCESDAECDNNLFCDGEERCVAGECTSGESPCGSDKICKEAQSACLSVEKLTATSPQTRLLRPLVLDKKCTWLVLWSGSDNHFSATESLVTIEGPADDSAGLTVHAKRTAFERFGFIFVPVCIEKNAATGKWGLELATDVRNSEGTYQEIIVFKFEII